MTLGARYVWSLIGALSILAGLSALGGFLLLLGYDLGAVHFVSALGGSIKSVSYGTAFWIAFLLISLRNLFYSADLGSYLERRRRQQEFEAVVNNYVINAKEEDERGRGDSEQIS